MECANVVRACKELAEQVKELEKYEDDAWSYIYDRCTRAFYNYYMPAESITFQFTDKRNVIAKATIYNTGKLEIHTI